MSKEQLCAGNCGKMIKTGLFSSDSYIVDGKFYCFDCMKKLPKYVGKECYQCAYYGIDDNYDGFCKKDSNKYVDRNKKACEQYETK
ncbi:MAG: hypothetical protein MJ090_04240 [Clostridia bacterium]|nr:hypothetical protein [Clostridia bacterium]